MSTTPFTGGHLCTPAARKGLILVRLLTLWIFLATAIGYSFLQQPLQADTTHIPIAITLMIITTMIPSLAKVRAQ